MPSLCSLLHRHFHSLPYIKHQGRFCPISLLNKRLQPHSRHSYRLSFTVTVSSDCSEQKVCSENVIAERDQITCFNSVCAVFTHSRHRHRKVETAEASADQGSIPMFSSNQEEIKLNEMYVSILCCYVCHPQWKEGSPVVLLQTVNISVLRFSVL